jgi:hypothetical protein
MAWDLDSLIDLSLRKASEIGALNRADRQAVVADATARWQAELAGRENVARIGEEGATGRATMQYGLGGASDRGLRSHELVASGQVGLGDRQIAAGLQTHGMQDVTTRRGQDITAGTAANRLAVEAPNIAAQTFQHQKAGEAIDPKTEIGKLGRAIDVHKSNVAAFKLATEQGLLDPQTQKDRAAELDRYGAMLGAATGYTLPPPTSTLPATGKPGDIYKDPVTGKTYRYK